MSPNEAGRMVSAGEDLRTILTRARVIAVLGAHPNPAKPAHYVPAYLAAHGYRIIPVNPAYAGQRLWGETVRASLGEIDEAVDIVDVFRRPEHLPGHLDEILALEPRPVVVWLQAGIRHDEVAGVLVAAGIDVVQDRCTLAEHRRLM